jgi:DNA helicase-2/ATP-dependent DNA helicase PcrA
MANKLIVAAAGSGKTTYIVHEALREPTRRTLITTFTNANEREIIKKFYELNGSVPTHVVVQTWFSFLLEHGVKPFQSCVSDAKINGVFLTNRRSTIYVREADFDHYYLTSDRRVYTDKLSKLAVRCDQKSNGNVMQRIRRIFPRAFVDEVQDMSGYDLDFIRLLMESGVCVTMVGDPRQTTYSTHNEKRHERYKGGRIQDFIKDECNDLCEVDTSSFAINYRCNDAICHLANQLFPKYPPSRSGQKEATGHDCIIRSIRPSDPF